MPLLVSYASHYRFQVGGLGLLPPILFMLWSVVFGIMIFVVGGNWIRLEHTFTNTKRGAILVYLVLLFVMFALSVLSVFVKDILGPAIAGTDGIVWLYP